jgi:hypothetical protein
MSPRRHTTPTSTHTRRLASLATLGAVALTVLAAACADAPSAPRAAAIDAPTAARSSSLLGGVVGGVIGGVVSTVTGVLTPVTGLQWAKPATAATVSGVIGAEGGSIAVPNGARLIVPRGAVAGPVTFSITRLPGRIVAYDFQPHGLRFAVPAQIEQPIGNVDLRGVATSSIEGAYFESAAALDQSAGTAQVSEFRPTEVLIGRGVVRFTVDHFSGYMVSTGRTR